MAKIGTHVARAFEALRERLEDDAADVDVVRSWWLDDVTSLSSSLTPVMESTRENPIWAALLARSPDELPTTCDAWDRFVAELESAPSSVNPHAVFAWAADRVWDLSVFVDPDEGCDEDQYDLEVWWSERDQRALFVCGFLEHEFEFVHRPQVPGTPDLEAWRGQSEGLLPADRGVVARLYPEVVFVPPGDPATP